MLRSVREVKRVHPMLGTSDCREVLKYVGQRTFFCSCTMLYWICFCRLLIPKNRPQIGDMVSFYLFGVLLGDFSKSRSYIRSSEPCVPGGPVVEECEPPEVVC